MLGAREAKRCVISPTSGNLCVLAWSKIGQDCFIWKPERPNSLVSWVWESLLPVRWPGKSFLLLRHFCAAAFVWQAPSPHNDEHSEFWLFCLFCRTAGLCVTGTQTQDGDKQPPCKFYCMIGIHTLAWRTLSWSFCKGSICTFAWTLWVGLYSRDSALILMPFESAVVSATYCSSVQDMA